MLKKLVDRLKNCFEAVDKMIVKKISQNYKGFLKSGGQWSHK